jgi:alpha-amylase/alpha-mannosidase (GH57 family)
MPDAPPRYVVIHGHFYQPPRENPWIEAVEKQPSAAPNHDWNERVARECYIPNTAARVMAGERILDIVNNYGSVSFDFGPTLLSWFESFAPREYRALVDADRSSVARLGRGNAIAQAFNHMILPLSSPRDRATQIRWGLADFASRFGRPAEAMWLPETAVNADTLRSLIDSGLRYAILAPGQADKVRRLGRGGRWHEVSDGSISTRRAYRWFDKDARGHAFHDRHIDILFYDGDLAKSIAFEHGLRDSKSFADRIEAAFDPKSREPQLVHFATDGESYGHHEKYGEMGLAHLLKYELPSRGIEVLNYAAYLDRHPPVMEAEIKPGLGTSWSCPHGVGRWLEDCGCSRGAWQQKWRGPMRRALDWLRDGLAAVFESEGSRLFRDPWAARDAYIDVVLDRGGSLDRFMRAHLSVDDVPDVRRRALKLLEMQRHSMLMFTSCGWFFSEISGVEAVQNLKYAARAAQLARELTGRDWEAELLPQLREAPSNLPEYGDGWGVYDKLVRPSVLTPDQLVGQYALSLLFGDLPDRASIHHFRLERSGWARNTVAGTRLSAGKVAVESGITLERWERQFLALALPDQTLRAYVAEGADFEALRARVLALKGEDLLKGVDALRRPFFGDRAYTLESLFADERERVFSLIIEGKLDKLAASYEAMFEEYFPLIEELARLQLPAPPLLKQEVELALGHRIASEVAAVSKLKDPDRLQEPRSLVERARRAGLRIHTDVAEKAWAELVERSLDELEREPSEEAAKTTAWLFAFGLDAGFVSWRYPAENRVFRMLSDSVFPRIASGPSSGERPLLGALLALGERLGIVVEDHRRRLEAQPSAA